MTEKLLLDLDVGVSGAVIRALLGAALVPVVHLLFPAAGLPVAVACLLVLLFGVKTFAAVARRFVPATDRVRASWEWRRNLARAHDSYQWRKLTWFGAGVLAASGASGTWELPLGIACLAGGAVGELFWRRAGVPLAPPMRG